MARSVLSVQQPTRDGLNATYTTPAAAGANEGVAFPNTGRETMHVKNASAGAVTLTIPTPLTIDGLAVADRTVSVPAGGDRFIGPFPGEYYNQSDGHVYVEFSAVASVSVAAIKV